MRHFKRLSLSCMAFLLIFTMALFPGSSTRKEIRIFDTFKNYTVDKPFKIYPGTSGVNCTWFPIATWTNTLILNFHRVR